MSSPLELVDVVGLTPDPLNARRHGDRNREAIKAAIMEVGLARSIVIDEDGVILAGNATVRAAQDSGITKLLVVDSDGGNIVAVRRIGLTPKQKARLALYDNRAAELAEGWDVQKLAEVLEAAGIDLSGLWLEEEQKVLFEQAPMVMFKEFDESAEGEVAYCVCPACQARFPR